MKNIVNFRKNTPLDNYYEENNLDIFFKENMGFIKSLYKKENPSISIDEFIENLKKGIIKHFQRLEKIDKIGKETDFIEKDDLNKMLEGIDEEDEFEEKYHELIYFGKDDPIKERKIVLGKNEIGEVVKNTKRKILNFIKKD